MGSDASVHCKFAPDISDRVSMPLGSGVFGQSKVLASWEREVPASWVSAPRITCSDSSPGSAS
jgi:hypothetical protein